MCPRGIILFWVENSQIRDVIPGAPGFGLILAARFCCAQRPHRQAEAAESRGRGLSAVLSHLAPETACSLGPLPWWDDTNIHVVSDGCHCR